MPLKPVVSKPLGSVMPAPSRTSNGDYCASPPTGRCGGDACCNVPRTCLGTSTTHCFCASGFPKQISEDLCVKTGLLQLRPAGGIGGGVGGGAPRGAPPRAVRAAGRGAPRVLRPHAPLQVPPRLRGSAATGPRGRLCRMQGCRFLGWRSLWTHLVSPSAGGLWNVPPPGCA